MWFSIPGFVMWFSIPGFVMWFSKSWFCDVVLYVMVL